MKSIADADSGDLAKFIRVSALKPFINKDLVLAELLEFSPFPQSLISIFYYYIRFIALEKKVVNTYL